MYSVSNFIPIKANLKENEKLMLVTSKYDDDNMSIFYSNDDLYEEIEISPTGNFVNSGIMSKDPIFTFKKKDISYMFKDNIPLHIVKYDKEIKSAIMEYVHSK